MSKTPNGPDKSLRTVDPQTGTKYRLETSHLQGFEDVLDLSEQIYQKVIQPWLRRYSLPTDEVISLGTAPALCAALQLENNEESRKRVARALVCCATSGIHWEVKRRDRFRERRTGLLFEIVDWESECQLPREPFSIRFLPLLASHVRRFEILYRQQRAGEQLQ